MASLNATKDEMQRLVKDLDQAASTYENARRDLRNLALKLALRLESPVESHDRTLFEVSSPKCPSQLKTLDHRCLTMLDKPSPTGVQLSALP